MNERIEKFSEQARLYADSMYPSGLDIAKWGPAYQEKFAELIVKECINVCEPVLDEPYEDMDEFGKGLVEGQDVAVEKIKKHFGVE